MSSSFFFPAHLSSSAAPRWWGESVSLPRSARLKSVSVVRDGVAAASSDASFYELLGISESVSLSEIKQAYKQMARKYHPDVSPPDLAAEYTRRFIRVQEAYETLSDPGRRAMYDRDLARGLHLAFSARKRLEEVWPPFVFSFFFSLS